jgi:hypothetical protein
MNHIPSEHGPCALWQGPENIALSPAKLIDAFRHAEIATQLAFVTRLRDTDARKRWNGADDILATRLANILIERLQHMRDGFLERR